MPSVRAFLGASLVASVAFADDSAETCAVAGGCGESSSPVKEHQLLQLAKYSAVEKAPGQFGDRSDQGMCVGMSAVKRTCSNNGCKVLADRMHGRTCSQYCADQNKQCVGAWEEHNNDCNVKAELTCEQSYPHTSDLLCECAPGAPPSMQSQPGQLVWSDEFDGSQLDLSKWGIVRGGGGFGNNERQYYRGSNARLNNGVLRIEAKCEEYNGEHYTSSKLETKHKAQWGPGHRVDVRARLPNGKGTWPAIWMLPVDNAYGGWPRSGEIDIMEAVGCTQHKVYGTIHTQAYNHMKHTEKFNTVSMDVTEWHTYSIEWSEGELLWFVDGQQYHRFAPSANGDSEKWPFNREFFLILNVAVGGSWGGMCVGGAPSCSAADEFGNTQAMEVDFARVYRL